jgi:hypothetical protein
MFRQICQAVGTNWADIFQEKHPFKVQEMLEYCWNIRPNDLLIELGRPHRRSSISGMDNIPDFSADIMLTQSNHLWDHLIYAYMIENTGVFEVFRKIILQYRDEEKLGAPQEKTQNWLRNTEELFFKDTSPFYILSLTSQIRPDMNAIRRNAYYRMFGMDLNHGTSDNKPYPYRKTDEANKQFIETLEKFLTETWMGITNLFNYIGQNPTDNAAIAFLAQKLQDMLLTRRQRGILSREEFVAVAAASWFHMSLYTNQLTIIQDLRSYGQSPGERLQKIAQLAGVSIHAKTQAFFDLAIPLSYLLCYIEEFPSDYTNTRFSPADAPYFYSDPDMIIWIEQIIINWSIVTGRDLKERVIRTRPQFV